MTDYEVYDKFFADEEYDLKNTSVYEYSYWGGWNNALKRASILIRNEIRPQGEWIKSEGKDIRDCFYTCSICGRSINVICGETLADYPFCHCGAEMKGGAV